MHAQFARGTALVALVFLQDGHDKSLFELAHRFGVKNVALIHLHDERFQLIFHGGALFLSVFYEWDYDPTVLKACSGAAAVSDVKAPVPDKIVRATRPTLPNF